ncbi:MAG TPA: BON domain-containing protein [Burkholderiales bacterium]|nr:BON domain-containing protein [Burkholderiales bacterium]
MRKHLALLAALALCACGESAPPPKPAPPKPAAPAQPAPPPKPAAAPAPTPAVEKPPTENPNTQLAARVKQALESASVQAAGVDVTAANGTVTLFGTVPSNEEKSRAARIAGKVPGVTSVDNRIVVVRGS